MQFIADLHIHSHFSRATSKMLIPEYLDYWAAIKGIKVVGTGDFTHPGWLEELKEKLEPEGNGLFRLKNGFKLDYLTSVNDTRFLLTAEISNIYKKGGQVRKVHNVVLVPGFDEAEKINQRLLALGCNLKSDGRPIIGLGSHDLLEIVLSCNENNIFIPAHIWTPWFSMLGSKSGFDSPEECFGSLWPYIHSVETGLSTDAPMNWLCSFLDRVNLVSNSDAHSPDRLGRNANVFDAELSFNGIKDALEGSPSNKFLGTIDLFPQEGKYHYDGHRKCNVCQDPLTTIRNNSICPVCGKPVTVGVMNRIIHLSDREDFSERQDRHPFRPIIPLPELISEIEGVGEKSKKVQAEYRNTIIKFGNETDILLNIPFDEIERKTSPVLAEAIRRMRNREIIVKEGYDGEYGQIKVFNPGEIKGFSAGNGLFGFEKPAPPQARAVINFDLKGMQDLLLQEESIDIVQEAKPSNKVSKGGLNDEQKAAVEYTKGASIIIAGPGTGKTKTLTSKIAYIVKEGLASPEQILAITFTNKAAGEMQSRLKTGLKKNSGLPMVYTFHGFGKYVLEENAELTGREPNFTIIGDDDKSEILKSFPSISTGKVKSLFKEISVAKQSGQGSIPAGISAILNEYEKKLKEFNSFDFDDLIAKPLGLFCNHKEVIEKYRQQFKYVFIDEFQDTNNQQFNLIEHLVGSGNPNLCVVGDPNQAIYSFRGGGSAMIGRFTKHFPDARMFRLKTSYRCPQNILTASDDVLCSNNYLSGLDSEMKINISEQATDKSEAEFIAREIVKLSGGLSFFSIDSNVADGQKNDSIKSLSDFAVLCRTRHQFSVIEKAFNNHSIPYQVVGEKPFYREPPISGLLELYFIAIAGNANNYARWLADKKDVITKEKLEMFHSTLPGLPVVEGLNKIRGHFFADVKDDGQLFRRLTTLAGNMQPHGFLSALKLSSPSDTYNEKHEAVTLMTLHASKGLEFECVFIAGCEQGVLPFNLYNKEIDEDEEKRLLYVGMTRSKKFLYLSHARKRLFRNRSLMLGRSIFLDKIEEELIEKMKPGYKKKQGGGTQLDLFN